MTYIYEIVTYDIKDNFDVERVLLHKTGDYRESLRELKKISKKNKNAKLEKVSTIYLNTTSTGKF